MKYFKIKIIAGTLLLALCFVAGLMIGPAQNDAYIIWNVRLPRLIVACFSGAALAVSGVILQTLFANPLAGPSILGINSGANLAIALFVLTGISFPLFGYYFMSIFAAFIASMLILVLLLLVSRYVKENASLLIVGIMLGFITSAIISILTFLAPAASLKSYLVWGLGSFDAVSIEILPMFVALQAIGLIGALLSVKNLNCLMLGDSYAVNLGINIKRTRASLLCIVGLLVSVTTAFCGPISFIGLAVPHLTRILIKNSDHRYIMPSTALFGALLALICCLISVLPSQILPINALTPIFGAPIIIYLIMSSRRL